MTCHVYRRVERYTLLISDFILPIITNHSMNRICPAARKFGIAQLDLTN